MSMPIVPEPAPGPQAGCDHGGPVHPRRLRPRGRQGRRHGLRPDLGGTRPGAGRYRTRGDFLDDMRALVAQGELDIMLTSASNGERLARDGSLGDSDMTLAVRGNDSTDVWNSRGGRYPPCRRGRSARPT